MSYLWLFYYGWRISPTHAMLVCTTPPYPLAIAQAQGTSWPPPQSWALPQPQTTLRYPVEMEGGLPGLQPLQNSAGKQAYRMERWWKCYFFVHPVTICKVTSQRNSCCSGKDFSLRNWIFLSGWPQNNTKKQECLLFTKEQYKRYKRKSLSLFKSLNWLQT